MAVQTTAADFHLRSSQAMSLSSLSPFSVTCWVNAVWNGGSVVSLVGIYGGSSDAPLAAPVTAMQIGTNAGNYDLRCWTWGGAALVATANGVMTGFNNVWVQITYTFDGTNHRLYRNGVLLASAVSTQPTGQLNQVYINGYPGSGTGETVAFQIDQYALYRRALSADEILTMYYAGGFRHGIVNDLICRYEFDELAQGVACNNVPDLSGNGHTLTSVGAGTPFSYTYTNTLVQSNIRPVL